MGDGWGGVPADVFTAILLRIQLIHWRWLRLVCRHWRDVIDERTPEPRAHAKVLAFYTDGDRSRAFVVDGLPGGRRSVELNLPMINTARMIGTCNGLLCLWMSDDYSRGQIAVVNPAIREMITVNAPVTACSGRDATYSFGCHPATTGQYKILHVPLRPVRSSFLVCDSQAGEFDKVHVLTLGDVSSREWREVPAPAGSSCNLRFGFVSVHGVTYWVTEDAKKIMSFDLKDERVALVKCQQMPVLPAKDCYFYEQRSHLTDVRGRVGLAVGRSFDEFARSKIEVWVLEGGREEEQTWVKRYTILMHGVDPRQKMASPHIVHGEHVLTTYTLRPPFSNRRSLNAHQPREERKMRPCLMLRLGAPRPETATGVFEIRSECLQTFAYVETREPVVVYGDGIVYGGGRCDGEEAPGWTLVPTS
ncbi:hypothetical protein EJB05_35378 [Eragrostis curvula]|uniref:F-box associated beta-propeller type 3 domain-containing protein n=1 Tax=Eragrostis curvula TaxID=38414 RepID=A0A5J9U6G3_9POAL|nr:hypothetical protein EJB05_35378 [Eragrostis curvula]